MKWGGSAMEDKLRQYIEVLGWLTIGLAVLAYFIIKG